MRDASACPSDICFCVRYFSIEHHTYDEKESIIPRVKLDEIDRRIIGEIQADGRITNQELADRVGLSASPCLRRVRMLEDAGVIKGYVGLVDPGALGLPVTAFVRIRLASQRDDHLAVFEEQISSLAEVMECYLMTGESDYQLRVIVPSLAGFEDFLRQKLTTIPGVSQVTSSFALRPVVYRTALPATYGDR